MRVKKPKMISFLVFVLFFVISFISCIVINEIQQHSTLINASRGYYGKSQIVFSADVSSNFDIVEAVKKVQNVSLYKDGEISNVRQIYINGRYNNPPVCSGRFFNFEDFSDDKISEKLAVIGKNMVPLTKEINGQKYIEISHNFYKVIGVVSLDDETMLNNTIFIKFDPDLHKHGVVYKLDIFKGNENSIFEDISKEIENKTHVMPKKIVLEKEGLERILPEINHQKVYILAIICLLISSITVSMEWATTLQRKVAVKRLVGCSRFRLIFEILIDYFKVSLSAGVLGMIFSFAFIRKFSSLVLFAVVISVLCGIIVIVPVTKKLLKVPVSEVLAR